MPICLSCDRYYAMQLNSGEWLCDKCDSQRYLHHLTRHYRVSEILSNKQQRGDN